MAGGSQVVVASGTVVMLPTVRSVASMLFSVYLLTIAVVSAEVLAMIPDESVVAVELAAAADATGAQQRCTLLLKRADPRLF